MSDNGAHEHPGAETLEQAVRVLLRSVPETWSEYDRATLTEPCEQGLALLVAAGMVEQRWSFRLRMFGHPVVVEATATVTGEYGAVEALERVAAGVWEQWGQAWQERMKGPTKDAPAFHCERIGREQWRLTADGIRAREDLETDAATVFDFVLKRGFFDGWSRLSPDGRISQRLSVRGRGVLEKLELVTADAPSPAGVSITNWDEWATAFTDALTRWSAAMQAKALLPAESSVPTGQSRPAEFAFYRDGDGWFIRGFGKEGLFKGTVGFEYIHRLLAACGPVAMGELVAGGRKTGKLSTADDVLDQEARQSYHQRLAELNAELGEARRNNALAALERLEREKQMILDQLRSAKGLGGRGRKLGDETDKLRSRIANALERACSVLDTGGLSTVADHFRVAISAQGGDYIYQPAERPAWSLSKPVTN